MNIDWSAIRNDYESGLSLRQLAVKYGVSKSAIGQRKYDEQWATPAPRPQESIKTRDVNTAERVALAMECRRKGMTYEEIAKACSYSHRSDARKAIMRELQNIVCQNVEELRREEGYTLDVMQQECMEIFLDKDNKGRLFAADRILAIMERRAKLFNLDKSPEEEAANQPYTKKIILTHAPQQSSVEVSE